MELVIDPAGICRCIYAETIPLGEIGTLTIRRASHVEPDAQGRWWADLAPVGGPALGPFDRRGQALEAEQTWLQSNWLAKNPATFPKTS